MTFTTRRRALSVLAAAPAAMLPPARASAASALSVGQIGTSIAFFPLFVAKSEGYFADGGIDVTVTAFQSGTLVGTAVTSGSIDLGCSVITDVFALLKAGRSARIVGSLVDGYYVDIVASNRLLAATKLSRASKLRDKILALKGKRIGITGPGSGTEALVKYLLNAQHIDATRDVELVNVGTDQAAILAALRTGRIDAVSFAWPLSMIAETQNVGAGFIMPADGDVPEMRGQIQGVMYARDEALTRKEAEITAFVRAIARAETLIHRDTARARVALRQYDPQMNDAAVDKLFAAYLPALPLVPRVSVVSYEKALAFHRELGYAGPAGNGYGEVVAGRALDRALRS